MKRFFSVAFFKDKKNIAILALIVLLLGSYISYCLFIGRGGLVRRGGRSF